MYVACSHAVVSNVLRSVETASETEERGSEKEGSMTDLEENGKPMKKDKQGL